MAASVIHNNTLPRRETASRHANQPSEALPVTKPNGSSAPPSSFITQHQQPEGKAPRRTSFNFLRRTKSSETKPPTMNRVTSGGGKMSKKQRAQAQEDLARQQREAAALARSPPRLPTHSPLPTINAFGGAPGQAQEYRPDNAAMSTNRAGHYSGGYQPQQEVQGGPQYHAVSSHVPIPPAPHGSSPGSRNGEDPYARTESMTHRGRYSYASSAVSMGTVNSPRRVRRRKDPTPFKYVTNFARPNASSRPK